MKSANENFIFRDFGITREEVNNRLKDVITALDNGTEIDGVTGDSIYEILYFVNALINEHYGITEE